jgi:hypothetical protein
MKVNVMHRIGHVAQMGEKRKARRKEITKKTKT